MRTLRWLASSDASMEDVDRYDTHLGACWTEDCRACRFSERGLFATKARQTVGARALCVVVRV